MRRPPWPLGCGGLSYAGVRVCGDAGDRGVGTGGIRTIAEGDAFPEPSRVFPVTFRPARGTMAGTAFFAYVETEGPAGRLA